MMRSQRAPQRLSAKRLNIIEGVNLLPLGPRKAFTKPNPGAEISPKALCVIEEIEETEEPPSIKRRPIAADFFDTTPQMSPMPLQLRPRSSDPKGGGNLSANKSPFLCIVYLNTRFEETMLFVALHEGNTLEVNAQKCYTFNGRVLRHDELKTDIMRGDHVLLSEIGMPLTTVTLNASKDAWIYADVDLGFRNQMKIFCLEPNVATAALRYVSQAWTDLHDNVRKAQKNSRSVELNMVYLTNLLKDPMGCEAKFRGPNDGLRNAGLKCWWNTLIQMLGSAYALVETIISSPTLGNTSLELMPTLLSLLYQREDPNAENLAKQGYPLGRAGWSKYINNLNEAFFKALFQHSILNNGEQHCFIDAFNKILEEFSKFCPKARNLFVGHVRQTRTCPGGSMVTATLPNPTWGLKKNLFRFKILSTNLFSGINLSAKSSASNVETKASMSSNIHSSEYLI